MGALLRQDPHKMQSPARIAHRVESCGALCDCSRASRRTRRVRVAALGHVRWHRHRLASLRRVAAHLGDEHDPHKPPMVFIATGDHMGDIHAAMLARNLQAKAGAQGRQLQLCGIGGKRMAEEGVQLLGNSAKLSSIGLVEAVPFIFPALRLKRTIQSYLRKNPPDVVVLIDYPGFNMPFGKWVKRNCSCKVVYYIPPNEWLFLSGRSNDVCACSDAILTVYPEEHTHFKRTCISSVHYVGHPFIDDVYDKYLSSVYYVGHPLIDYVCDKRVSKAEARKEIGLDENDIVVTMLPASRTQEMNLIFPTMMEVASKINSAGLKKRVHFLLSLALEGYEDEVKTAANSAKLDNITIWKGNSLTAIAASDVCLSKSGSTSLEVALMDTPQVVLYRVGLLTAWAARRLLKFNLKYVSLVNLVLEKAAVPEYIQEDIDVEEITAEMLRLLPLDNNLSDAAVKQLGNYKHLKEILRSTGASGRASDIVLNLLHRF